MKKAVIFDLNGVFIEGKLLSDHFRDEKHVPTKEFMPVLHETMDKVRRPGAGSVYSYWKKYLEQWGLGMGEGEFLDFWFSSEKENVEMVAFARQLKQKGVRLFILSNNLRERSAYYDKNFPFLKELFEKEYYSWQTGFVKPDPQCFELMLKENNLKPEECIYFDDVEKNVEAARALGIESYVFEGAAAARAELL